MPTIWYHIVDDILFIRCKGDCKGLYFIQWGEDMPFFGEVCEQDLLFKNCVYITKL